MDPLIYSYNTSILKMNLVEAYLPKDIQEKILKKKIIFQGRRINSKEFFAAELLGNYNYEALRELLLLEDDTINVGSEVPGLHEDIKCCYIHRHFYKGSVEIDEEYICKSKEKMMLIEGTEGLGKSTVFMNLAQTIKKENPELWIIRIELNDYTNILEDLLRSNCETITIWTLLNSKDTLRTNQLEKMIYSTKKRIVLLLNIDGINSKFMSLVSNLLIHCLLASNFKKVLVSIRPNMVRELEAILQLKTVTMHPFSEKDQVNFLIKYWIYDLKIGDENREKCEEYARTLLRKFVWKISLYEEITPVPVQLKILGEVFKETFKSTELDIWEGCKNFINTNKKEPEMPKEWNVIKLYKVFMEKKRNDFLNKEFTDERRQEYEEYIAFYRTLAIESIVDKETREHFLSYQPDLKNMGTDVLKMGIIKKFGNDYQFLHRSLAEYFLGECSARELRLRNQNANFQEFVIEQILPSFALSLTRAFFNNFLEDHIDSLPFDIFQSYIDTIKERKFYVYFLLHYLVWDGYVPIMKLVFKSMSCQRIKDKGCSSYKNCNVFQFLILDDGINIHDERGTRPIHDAVSKGYLEIVKFLVEQGANINIRDDSGNTPLLKAVRGRHFEIVKFLVEQANDAAAFIGKAAFYASFERNSINIAAYFFEKVLDKCEDTMIAYAASFLGHCDILERILNKGFDVNTKFQRQETLLFSAVKGGQSDIIKYLVQKGADVNSQNADGETVLFLSCEAYIVKLLLELGIDVNVRSSYLVKSALHKAVERGTLDIVQLLAESGADIQAKDTNERSALISAVIETHQDIVRYLIKMGVDVNERDKFQQTALYWCIMRNDLNMIKFLVENGADVHIKFDKGYTAVHIAALQGYLNIAEYFIQRGVCVKTEQDQEVLNSVISRGGIDVVKFFVKYGVDVNIKVSNGNTILFSAITNCQLDVVVFLVAEGHADLEVVDNMKRTALHIAALNGNLSIVKFLIAECGMDINAKDKEGRTAFHLTALQTNSYLFYVDNPVTDVQLNARLSILKYLMSHGASIYDTDIKGNTAETLAKTSKRRDLKKNELVKCLQIWRIAVECAVCLQRVSEEIGIMQ